jgi:transposase
LNQTEGTRRRKATIIVDVLKATISVPEACRKYGFTQGEYREWADEFMRGGINALKVNRNGLEAEYRAEIKRLQAKIGELVMDNEIICKRPCESSLWTKPSGDRSTLCWPRVSQSPSLQSLRRAAAAARTTNLEIACR